MVRTAHAVAAGLEVAHAMAPVVLKAGRLVDLKAGSCRPYVHEGFDLEDFAIGRDEREASPPESVVSVAEITELATPEPFDNLSECPVADAAERSTVGTAATGDEVADFGEVSAAQESGNEAGYLGWVGGPVPVQHDDDVTGRSPKTGGCGVALALADLPEHSQIWPELLGHLDGAIGGVSMDKDHF
jgi:hypothetical protein